MKLPNNSNECKLIFIFYFPVLLIFFFYYNFFKFSLYVKYCNILVMIMAHSRDHQYPE